MENVPVTAHKIFRPRPRSLLLLVSVSAAMFSSVALARMEPLRRAPIQLHYKEETSYGSAKPDDVAKPAETDVYSRRDAPPNEAEQPATKAGAEPQSSDSQSKRVKPKYREIYDNAAKKDSSYDDGEDSVGVSVGVGFGFSYFSGSLGLTFPINHYLAWGVSGNYFSREEKKIAEIKSGGDLALILRIPNFTPLTPFVSAGPGYTAWKRSKDDGAGLVIFDDSSSPTGEWAVGASIRLARYVSLVGALRSTTFTDSPPKMFAGNHASRELRTKERFEFGFAFGF